MEKNKEEEMIEDVMVCGVFITLDGKRIDPRDFYK